MTNEEAITVLHQLELKAYNGESVTPREMDLVRDAIQTVEEGLSKTVEPATQDG